MFLRKHEIVYKNSTVNADAFDKRRFNELLKMSKGLKEIKSNGDAVFPLFSQLMGDIWSALYKSKPDLITDEIPKELLPNYSYMEKVMAEELFKGSRELTKLDDLSSALSTISFSNQVLDWINEEAKNNGEFKNALEKAMESYNQQKNDEGENTTENKNQQQGSNEHENNMQQLADQLESSLTGTNTIGSMLQESIKESQQKKENMQKILSGITSGSSSAEMEKVPLRDKFELAQALEKNPNFKKISDWAGKFKQLARSKQKVKHKETVNRSGVTIGNEIERLLPSEMANMAIPAAKNDFVRRLSESQTMVYNKKGKDKLGKGPIILCLDESGSMRNLESQSKGFALAIMSIAQKQKRDFALISFSNNANVTVFPKGKSDVKDIIKFAKSFMSGGTNFFAPLKNALQLINGSRFKNADIIFVTDGEANLTKEFIEEFNKIKVQKKFQCLSILIGSNVNEETVSKFSDNTVKAKDFTQADKAFEV
ncbi:vWA domain-containing protein [Cytobacillus horneckiae]|nr:VWA domain-containing protein [Cytobacillus horneckiae]MEC1158718.1 VWA domain-containing protein [Cytobacillus horneckiae]NRG47622.1 VWA domain-containing protein [Bacillus sp. CRN 9]